MADLEKAMALCAEKVDDAFFHYFLAHNAGQTRLYTAMEYSARSGGKRLRPFLTLSFCTLLGGCEEAALPYACALEMIHTFSLIHDDLPCMDNDDYRRGKLTNHKAFDEPTALLAGDALIFSAFEVMAESPYTDSENRAEAVRLLSRAAGADGMCEGQMRDILSENKEIPIDALTCLHSYKTGALIRTAAELGVLAAGGDSAAREAARTYGDGIGLAFQIIDDVLDRYGDAESLGKPVGSDAENGKTTYLTFMSAADALTEATRLTEAACAAIRAYPGSETLCALAEWLLRRTH